MNELIEEAQRLYTEPTTEPHHPPLKSINPYLCSVCGRVAKNPVVSACSHLYCWECIKDFENAPNKLCKICRFNIEKLELRTVFVQENEDVARKDGKPNPIYCQPIKNSSGVGPVSPATYIMHNNVDRKKVLGGFGLLSPQPFLILNSSEEYEILATEQEKNAESVWNNLRRILVIVLIVAVLIVMKP